MKQDPIITINQISYSSEDGKKIGFDQLLQFVKGGNNISVFYIDTKGKKEERRTGILNKGESIAVADGLNISCYRMEESGEETA